MLPPISILHNAKPRIKSPCAKTTILLRITFQSIGSWYIPLYFKSFFHTNYSGGMYMSPVVGVW